MTNDNQVSAWPTLGKLMIHKEGEDFPEICVITYRHMNRVPNNLNEGNNHQGGTIYLGDYRKIVNPEIIEQFKCNALVGSDADNINNSW